MFDLYPVLSKKICFFVICLATHLFAQESGPTWTYEDVQSWKEHFPSCAGAHQSPINLDPRTTIPVNYPHLRFGHYNDMLPESVSNNGHTIVLSVNQTGNIPYIEGGGLPNRFNFVQLHFHWGTTSDRGSEHLIDFRPYSAEVHIVHFNTKYSSFKEATAFADGLAVLAVMVEVQDEDSEAFDHLEQFDAIIDPTTGQSTMLPVSVAISELLPDDTSSFYRYQGSLTTPGCNEDVTWTVFDHPIGISERQLNQFRELLNEEGEQLEDNFRPVQPITDRIVTYRLADDVPMRDYFFPRSAY